MALQEQLRYPRAAEFLALFDQVTGEVVGANILAGS